MEAGVLKRVMPKPTVLYFSVTTPTSRPQFFLYLKAQLKNTKFDLVKFRKYDTITKIEVIFESVNKAKKAFKTLNRCNDFAISLKCEISVETVLEGTKNFKHSIISKNSTFSEGVKEKVTPLQMKLSTFRQNKRRSLQEHQMLEKKRKAVEQQIAECQLQVREFDNYCVALLQKLDSFVKSINNPNRGKRALQSWRKQFGIECNRLLKALPIYARRTEITTTIKQIPVTVLIGETGSGKSTQLVQYLYEAGFAERGKIVCTEPRKVAAVTLAKHVSEEMGVKLGEDLGYKLGIRGKYDPLKTKVLYVTDHTLLNECIDDPYFSKYSCIIVDEAHERSLHTDLLLSFIKKCLSQRKDLRVIITSATINPEIFVHYFGNCEVISVSGRTFPVEVVWNPLQAKDSPLTRNYVEDAVAVVKMIHRKSEEGDILAFLTTPPETEKACELLSAEIENAVILPIHGKLQPQEQQKVFHNYDPVRKIIFATNIAETSVTISGVKFIVDSGLAKVLCFDPKRNMNSLEVQPISRSSAEQRKGRAGRTSSGTCYRLYSEEFYANLSERALPEILRMHLSHAVLKLIKLGVSDVLNFDFVEQPDPAALQSAVQSLQSIDAITTLLNCETILTEQGNIMAALPIDPQLSRVLLDGIDQGVGIEAAVAVAASSVAGSIFFRAGTEEMKKDSDKKKFQFCHPGGDQMSHLYVYMQWSMIKKVDRNKWCVENCINAKSMRIIEDVVKELRDILLRLFQISLSNKLDTFSKAESILPEIFFKAFCNNLCVFLGRQKAGYMTDKIPDQSLVIFPGSVLCQLNLAPSFVIYEKTLKTSQHFLLQVTPVMEEWVDHATKEGRIAFNPRDRFKEYMVSPVSFCNIGEKTFKETIFYCFKDLIAKIASICEGTPIDLESKLEKGELLVFSQPKFHDAIRKFFIQKLNDYHRRLKKHTCESGVNGSDEDSTRIILGRGGCVQHVLMPGDYYTVAVKGSPDGNWIEDVKTLVSKSVEIYDCNFKVFGKGDCGSLYITLCSPRDAVKVMAEVSSELVEKSYKVNPCLPLNKKAAHNSNLCLKVMWTRRRKKNFAFIVFDSPEDFAIVTSYNSSIVVRGATLILRQSKKATENYFEVFATNIPQHVTEDSLKTAIRDRYGVLFEGMKVKFVFENVSPTTEEELQARKHQLQVLVAKYATKGKYNVNIAAPHEKAVDFWGFVNFQDPDEGHRALHGLEWEQIGTNQLTVKPLLSSKFRYSSQVYAVTKSAVTDTLSQMQHRYGKEKISVSTTFDKQNNTFINIKSENVKIYVAACKTLSSVTQQEVIECNTQHHRQFILSKNIAQFVKDVQQETSTYIRTDLSLMVIAIYGTENNRFQARKMLEDQLRKIEKSGVCCFDIHLKSEGRPPGLLKHLVSVYGFDLQRLLQVHEGMEGVLLEPRKQIVTIFASPAAYEKVIQLIDDYSSSHCKKLESASEKIECCVCFTEIENDKDIFRLEYCGHPYCSECIQLQVLPTTLSLPLQCAADSCSQQFVWQDCVNLFRRTNLTQKQLLTASVKSHVAANTNSVKCCPTPDCSMIYVASSEEKSFYCNYCSMFICTKCHVQYHEGVTCAMYQAGLHVDKELEEWMSQGRDRKRCPNCATPIEKISGCNNVHCASCKECICWVCLAHFSNDSECYNHLSSSHGSFM